MKQRSYQMGVSLLPGGHEPDPWRNPYVFPPGSMYSGEYVEDIPDDYLNWILENDKYPWMHPTIEDTLDWG